MNSNFLYFIIGDFSNPGQIIFNGFLKSPEQGDNMQEKSVTLILLFIFLLGIAGCMSIGRNFPINPVRDLQIGKTTKEDILHMFGAPWRTGIEDGDKTWTYAHYRYSLFSGSKTRDLVLRFNASDKLVSYSFNSSYPEDASR